MTYILGATTTSLYGDPTAVMDALAAAIVEFQADVFCATDLERNTARHSRRDMPALLAASLIARGYPMENRWHTRFGVDGGENGYVVFSRSPMEDYRVWDLPDANPWMETMPVQSFQLTVGTDRLRFFNLHPAPGWDDDGFYPCRSIDPAVFDIVDDFASSSVFLLGDFNIPINLTPGYCYEDLVARYTDACVPERDSSCDSTVAVDIVGGEPNTIDHIFFDFAGDTAHTWRLARTHVDQDANDEIVISDHYPVFAEFDYGAKEHVLLGDYDGDGRDQLVVHAPQSDGDIDWYVRGSTPFDWGFVGTRPVGGDFDGDGIDDPVVFEPATGSWYLLLRVCP
jgi:endonuclease/exonuclease/phosphatase family metal-dependent hydrolase